MPPTKQHVFSVLSFRNLAILVGKKILKIMKNLKNINIKTNYQKLEITNFKEKNVTPYEYKFKLIIIIPTLNT